MGKTDEICCSFCGKGNEALVLIKGPDDAAICDECVINCYEVLRTRIGEMLALRKLPNDLFFPLQELEASGIDASSVFEKAGFFDKKKSIAWWLTDLWRAIDAELAPLRKRYILERLMSEFTRKREKTANKNQRAQIDRRIKKLKKELKELKT